MVVGLFCLVDVSFVLGLVWGFCLFGFGFLFVWFGFVGWLVLIDIFCLISRLKIHLGFLQKSNPKTSAQHFLQESLLKENLPPGKCKTDAVGWKLQARKTDFSCQGMKIRISSVLKAQSS